LKKPTGSVQFFKHGTKKTEPNRKNRKKPSQNQTNRAKSKNRAKPEKTEPKPKNRAKPEKTEPNRFEPVFVLKNQTETGRFESVSVVFF
jgi:hypothetical protein